MTSDDPHDDFLVLDDGVPPTRCMRGDVSAKLQIAYDSATERGDKLTLNAVRAEILQKVDAVMVFKRKPDRIDTALRSAAVRRSLRELRR
jgi:hypothetical protein